MQQHSDVFIVALDVFGQLELVFFQDLEEDGEVVGRLVVDHVE